MTQPNTTTTLEVAAAATTLEIALAARAAQLRIRAALMQDVTKVWALLDAKRLDSTFPAWLRAMSLVVRNYHGQSSATAGEAYRKARAISTQSPAPRSLVKFASPPAQEWMDKAFGFSGPGMLSRDTARPHTALSVTLGTATRIALDGGRSTTLETIKADPLALGWYRVTDGAPCAFCALLASRGIVYKERSFEHSNERFTGFGEFKVHNDCGCSMAPAFSKDQELPEMSQVALEVYKNRGKGDAMKAFRKAWAERQPH